MKSFYFLFLIFILGACLSTRHGVKLSKFSYNERFHNSLIVNRVPDYGDGHRDGCIVQGEFFLSLKSTPNSEINGTLKDVESFEPIIGANISIWSKGQNSPSTLVTDSKGEFNFVRKSEIDKIEANFIGWRTMTLDLSRSRTF